jgi:hypothetical protein
MSVRYRPAEKEGMDASDPPRNWPALARRSIFRLRCKTLSAIPRCSLNLRWVRPLIRPSARENFRRRSTRQKSGKVLRTGGASRIEKIERRICYDDCQIKIRQLIGRSIGAGLRSDNNRGPYVSLIQGQVVNRSMRSCIALGAIVLTA